MTFGRLLPVIRKLRVLPWLSLSMGLLALFVLIIFSTSSTRNSNAQETPANKTEQASKFQQDMAEKLKNLKAEASSLKEQIGGRSQKTPGSGTQPAPIITGLSRSSGVSAGESSGFQKISNSKDSEIYIPMGSVFRAQLTMPIKTSIQETFVMAQTTDEFQYDHDPVRSIPVGSRLIGRAQLNPLLKSVAVKFHTLVTPRGLEFPVSIIALSNKLFGELNGIYFSNDAETYGAILAFGAVEGFANSAREYDRGFLYPTAEKSVSNNVWAGVSGASFRLTEDLIREVQNRRVEYVVVPSGDKIFVAFEQRFVIKDKKPLR